MLTLMQLHMSIADEARCTRCGCSCCEPFRCTIDQNEVEIVPRSTTVAKPSMGQQNLLSTGNNNLSKCRVERYDEFYSEYPGTSSLERKHSNKIIETSVVFGNISCPDYTPRLQFSSRSCRSNYLQLDTIPCESILWHRIESSVFTRRSPIPSSKVLEKESPLAREVTIVISNSNKSDRGENEPEDSGYKSGMQYHKGKYKTLKARLTDLFSKISRRNLTKRVSSESHNRIKCENDTDK